MVTTYAELLMQVRRALLPTEGEDAARIARELTAYAAGKSMEELLRDTGTYASQAVTEKRREVVEYIKSIGLKPLDGSATFYIFVGIGDYKYSSMELGLYLLTKYGISVVPGLAYGQSTERFIRIGVGAESMEEIRACMDIIKRVITENEYDDAFVESELKALHMNRFVPSE